MEQLSSWNYMKLTFFSTASFLDKTISWRKSLSKLISEIISSDLDQYEQQRQWILQGIIKGWRCAFFFPRYRSGTKAETADGNRPTHRRGGGGCSPPVCGLIKRPSAAGSVCSPGTRRRVGVAAAAAFIAPFRSTYRSDIARNGGGAEPASSWSKRREVTSA